MEVEEMVRRWYLERRKESQVEREKIGEDGDRRCEASERKRAKGRMEEGGQKTLEDGSAQVEMKEDKKQKEVRRGRCIGDSKKADRKRVTEGSEGEVGVVGKKEEDRAGEKDKVRKGGVGRKRERCRRWIEGILEWRRIWEGRRKRKRGWG